MVDSYTITSPLLVWAILGISGAIVIFGLTDIAVGIYAAILSWAYNVTVGDISLLWLSIASVLGSCLINFVRRRLRGKKSFDLSHSDVGLAVWMAFWTFWMFLLYLVFPSSLANLLMRNLILYCLLPFVVIILFINSIQCVQRLVIAFVITSCFAGFVAIRLLPAPIVEVLDDPLFRLRGMTSINYLSFAVSFGLSTVFGMSRTVSSTNNRERILMLVLTPASAILLLLTGARQSELALAVATIIFAGWTAYNQRSNRLFAALILTIVGAVSWLLYNSTQLWYKWSLLSTDYRIRVDYWTAGLYSFSKSIIWGNGFDYFQSGDTAHNMFIDTLAAQGIVGFTFLFGLQIIVFREVFRSFKTADDPRVPVWLATLTFTMIFTVVQASFSGGLISAPHFFWITALLWRVSNPPIAPLKTPAIRNWSLVRTDWKSRTSPRGFRGAK